MTYQPSFIAPFVSFEPVGAIEMNEYLTAWGHKMGPLERPVGNGFAHALRHEGKPVAVIATSELIAPEVCGLTRLEALEVSRVCASRRDLCRVVLRLWREFVFPQLDRPWAISYQDAVLHNGNLYRFDGWKKL